MAYFNCHVRIIVPRDSNGVIRNNDTTGHYELQIDGLNGANLIFDGHSFSNPVFSYGPSQTSAGLVQIYSSANTSHHNCYLCTFDFVAPDTSVYDLVINKLQNTYLNTSTETVDNGVVTYNVQTGPFATYSKYSTNCFTAVATWCYWLGYSYLLTIAQNASSYTDYLAWKLYDQYHTAWNIQTL